MDFSLSLKRKIMIGGGLGVVALFINQAIIFKQLQSVREIGVTLSDEAIPAISKVDELRIATSIIYGNYAEAKTIPPGEGRVAIESAIEQASGNLFIYRKTFEPLIKDAETQATYDKFGEQWDLFVAKCDEMMKQRDSNPAAVAGQWNEAKTLFQEADASLSKVATSSYESAVATSHRFQSIYANTMKLLFATLLGTFVFVVLSVWIFSTRLAKILTGIVDSITQSSYAVDAATSQLAVAGDQVAQGATSAASSLEEAVASLEQITTMVKNNSENASKAALLASSSNEIAANGSKEVTALVVSIKEIASGSRKMEDIINVIEDIAFQTNILSLNAAVEAARAGDHGKGFAVVADAVRNLAQRSATAAKEISSLIRDSVLRIGTSTVQADASGKVLREILQSTVEVSRISTDIADASKQQALGLAQISKAMNEIESATQTNAVTSGKVAEAATSLYTQADNLNRVVKDLEKVINGSTSEASLVSTSDSHKGTMKDDSSEPERLAA